MCEPLKKLVKQSVTKYPDDIDKCVDWTVARFKKLDEYAEYTESLIADAIRRQIHDERHGINVSMRLNRGDYGEPAKVVPGEATARVMRSVYSYMIAGRSLGSILGEELAGIASDEAARADGHMFNATLCQKLNPLVAKGKSVRQCVPEQKLQKIFQAVK